MAQDFGKASGVDCPCSLALDAVCVCEELNSLVVRPLCESLPMQWLCCGVMQYVLQMAALAWGARGVCGRVEGPRCSLRILTGCCMCVFVDVRVRGFGWWTCALGGVPRRLLRARLRAAHASVRVRLHVRGACTSGARRAAAAQGPRTWP